MKRALGALVLACIVVSGCGRDEDKPAVRTAPPTTSAEAPAQPPPRTEVRENCKAGSSRELRLCERERVRIVPCDLGEHPDYDPCGELPDWLRQTIELRGAGGWRVVARHPAGDIFKNMVAGYWRDAWLSPDGRTVLGQWSSECEVRFAFFVETTGGPLRVVTGERDWRRGPESIARGWTEEGWARVILPQGLCSENPEGPPGLYHIHPDSLEARFIRPVSGG